MPSLQWPAILGGLLYSLLSRRRSHTNWTITGQEEGILCLASGSNLYAHGSKICWLFPQKPVPPPDMSPSCSFSELSGSPKSPRRELLRQDGRTPSLDALENAQHQSSKRRKTETLNGDSNMDTLGSLSGIASATFDGVEVFPSAIANGDAKELTSLEKRYWCLRCAPYASKTNCTISFIAKNTIISLWLSDRFIYGELKIRWRRGFTKSPIWCEICHPGPFLMKNYSM